MLDSNKALLLVVDIQENLNGRIFDHEAMLARCVAMIQAARILNIPAILSEQYKKGLGETVAEIREALGPDVKGYEKLAFGLFGDPALRGAIEASGRKQLILTGVETHVCILQTALKGLEAGYDVFVAEDAVSSRNACDRKTALRRMRQAGVIPATVEMLIMEAQVTAANPRFKSLLPIVRDL